jgi:toxin ParE1/3/4
VSWRLPGLSCFAALRGEQKLYAYQGAGQDLREITRYTRAEWGEAQCLKYLSRIEAAAEQVAKGKGAFKTANDLNPGLRVVKSGQHPIFCQQRENAPALILATLHERMDMIERLKARRQG